MSTSGAAVWGHTGSVDVGSVDVGSVEAVGDVRLTRRGRLIRSGVLLVLTLLLALSVAGGFGDGSELVADTPSNPVAVRTTSVVVERGDSLWRIAQRSVPGSDPREVVMWIRELNGLRSNLIQPGQVLLLPSAAPR